MLLLLLLDAWLDGLARYLIYLLSVDPSLLSTNKRTCPRNALHEGELHDLVKTCLSSWQLSVDAH
jgi:hypothetical protein